MRILRFGSYGDDVKNLQHCLNEKQTSGLNEDGWFGSKTELAVELFQVQNGLAKDGVVGYNTYAKLGLLKNNSPEWLVLHCSATPGKSAGVDAQSIVDYHVRVLGWGKPGYARIIEQSGKVVETWSVDTSDGIQPFEVTYGVGNWGLGAGVDANALNVCYVGGLNDQYLPEDTRTEAQKAAMIKLVKDMIVKHPNIKVAGHNQFFNKACPSFFVPTWLKSIDIADANIYKEDPFGYSKIFK